MSRRPVTLPEGVFPVQCRPMTRRLPRILLNVATVMSLLLSMATVVLWVQSYWFDTSVAYSTGVGATGQKSWSATTYHARVTFNFWSCHFAPQGRERYVRFDNRGRESARLTWETARSEPLNEATRSRLPWFQFVQFHDDPPGDPRDPVYDTCRLTLPLPLVWLLTSILPTLGVTRHLTRRRRAMTGHCPACGYDLRATPDRCPECGKTGIAVEQRG